MAEIATSNRHSASVDPARQLLDSAGAAELLNVPKSWVLAEARAGRIPHIRLGRYVRFEIAELEAWYQARRQGPSRANISKRPARGQRDAVMAHPPTTGRHETG
jgi:excisionase family DNA binding protein